MKLKNLKKTTVYVKWIDDLKDRMAAARIDIRVKRLAKGNPGNHRFLGGGVSELIIDYATGYRVYYTKKENVIYILLCGGDKTTQQADIIKARKILKNVEAFL